MSGVIREARRASRLREPLRVLSGLWILTLAAGLLAFLAQTALARAWTVVDYGLFNAALASINLIAPVAAFGLGPWWLQAFGAEGWQARRWMRASALYMLVTAAAALAILLGWAMLAPEPRLRTLLLLLAPGMGLLLAVQLAQTRWQLEERFGRVSAAQILPVLPRVVAAVAAIAGAGLLAAGWTYLAASAVVVALLFRPVSGMLRSRIRLAGHGVDPGHAAVAVAPRPLPELVREAWPFGIAGILYMVLYQSDMVMIGWLRPAQEVAHYSVAYTLIAAIYLLPSSVYQKLVRGVSHRLAAHEPERFLALFRFGGAVMLLSGVAAMAGVLLLGTPLMVAVFGEPYRAAGPLLTVLAVALPIRFLAANSSGALLAGAQIRMRGRIMGIAALLNVALNLALIPLYGAYAAAWTTVGCEALQLALFSRAVHRHVFGAAAWRHWTLSPRALFPPAA